jgi:hypothetical protein
VAVKAVDFLLHLGCAGKILPDFALDDRYGLTYASIASSGFLRKSLKDHDLRDSRDIRSLEIKAFRKKERHSLKLCPFSLVYPFGEIQLHSHVVVIVWSWRHPGLTG